jgi:streptogramin lyase
MGMTDLEARLGEALKGVRDVHTESYRDAVPELRRRVVEKVRKRRIFYFGAVAAAATAVVVAALVLSTEVGRREALPPAGNHMRVTMIRGLSAHAVVATDSAIYAEAGTALYEIDPLTNELRGTIVAERTWPDSSELVAVDNSIWRAGWEGEITSQATGNPETGSVVQRIDVSTGDILVNRQSTNQAPHSIDVAGGYVWLGDILTQGIQRLDADTGHVLDIPVPLKSGYAADVAATEERVWFTSTSRLNEGVGYWVIKPSGPPDGNEVDGYTTVPAGGCPTALTLGHGSVWVLDACGGAILRFDNQTLQRVSEIPIPHLSEGDDLEFGLEHVWVVSSKESTVTRIDPDIDEVVGGPVDVGERPLDVDVGAGAVWIATSEGINRIDLQTDADADVPTESESPTTDISPPASPQPGEFRQSFAMWPEQSLGSSKVACYERSSAEPWRTDASMVAGRFATEELNWTAPALTVDRLSDGFTQVTVFRERTGSASVVLSIRKVPGQECWSVVEVTSDPDNDQDPGVRYARNGANVELHFDIGEATSAIGTVHFEGGRVVHSTADDESPIRIDLDYRPSTPGYYLLVLRDQDDEVFDADGAPLED